MFLLYERNFIIWVREDTIRTLCGQYLNNNICVQLAHTYLHVFKRRPSTTI